MQDIHSFVDFPRVIVRRVGLYTKYQRILAQPCINVSRSFYLLTC